MSDYNRSARTSPLGQTAGRATVAIDEGLRAYMLHVYNYMVLGLAITGLAALGIYMLRSPGTLAQRPRSCATVLRCRPALRATCTSRRLVTRSS